MTRKSVSLFMVTTCAMIISSPGRLVCGILLALELFYIVFFGTMFRSLLKLIKMKQLKSTIMCCFIVFLTILYKILISIWMADVSLQLSFVFYLTSISTFTTVFLFDENNYDLKTELINNIVPAGIYSAIIISFSLIRDLLGFGTITFPGKGKMIEIVLIKSDNISIFTYLASIPGVITFAAILLAVYLSFENKMNTIKKVEM